MCGLAGFLQTTSVIQRDAMSALAGGMSDALRHRGPDDAGTWADPEAGIALGHRRLSIIDLSAEGQQPMLSASGRYVIVFNGEIYNFEALREDLQHKNVRWRGHSDTEVMLAALEYWGVRSALERLNGMFAFAVWDRHERVLHLARDRLGEKPLYYGWLGKTFVFGSELKALRVHPSWRGEVDRDVLAVYLRYGYVPAPHSIYKHIAKLPPGTHLQLSVRNAGETPPPTPYWSMRKVAEAGVPDAHVDTETAIEELDALLRDAVAMRMVADVPVGVFLSGGVDSSTVVALMQAQSALPVKSFSIGFEDQAYNEAKHAKAVAGHLGTDHTELYVTPEEAMAVIPRLPAIYDEPFADSSQIPTILVSQLARRQVTVTLSGDGGDELFCGYHRYFAGQQIWNQIGWVPQGVRSSMRAVLKAMSVDAWNVLLTPFAPLLPTTYTGPITGDRIHKLADVLAVPSSAELYDGLMSHWSKPDAVVFGAREPASALRDPQMPALDDFTCRMMYLDAITYLPDDILVKVDRASMSVGLEARVPLLDHRIVEYAWRLPMSLKNRRGQGKWLLKQVLHRYVPRELVERPKMGFGVPIDAWLRGPLRGWAEELLDEKRLQAEEYFEPTPIRHVWAEHLSGKRDWDFRLWNILMFQAWLEHERR